MRSLNLRWFLGVALLVASCSPPTDPGPATAPEPAPAASTPTPATPTEGATVLFEGARIITGDFSAPLEDAAFVVRDGVFGEIGRRGELALPAGATRVDLDGKTVMPALVDLHSHLGYANIIEARTSADEYTRDNLIEQLRRYAYYGLATTLSLGLDRGNLGFALRDERIPGAARYRLAGRGIAPPNAGPRAGYWKDAPYGVTTADEARQAVRELAEAAVDVVKIWVDDRNGTVEKLSEPLYRAIIDEAHARGLRVVAHVYYLADGKALLRAGIDGFAHGIRDQAVDGEFVQLFKERPDVFLVPNLPDTPPNLGDLAWLRETLPAAQIDEMRASLAGGAPGAPALLAVQARNLARLASEGVRIGFGTDAGTGAPIGWSAHTELADMVAAGMSPAQVLAAATRTSAGILRMSDLGEVAAGKSADFVVLNANPLDDISNTRQIYRVYLRGELVERAALRTAWTGWLPE